MKKSVLIIICIALICPIFASCEQKKYNDDLSCRDIVSSLEQEILSENEYSEYSKEDLKYMFDDTHFESCHIIYSQSSDDIGEIGVFHANNADNAEELTEDVAEYIDALKEEKSDFLKNYLPAEFDKLDNASIKRFGNYVVYTVLPKDTSDKVFNEVKKLLAE